MEFTREGRNMEYSLVLSQTFLEPGEEWSVSESSGKIIVKAVNDIASRVRMSSFYGRRSCISSRRRGAGIEARETLGIEGKVVCPKSAPDPKAPCPNSLDCERLDVPHL
ncbi:hypothetical protein M758_UG322900 [Ceratodon purpureus]|nr:hypothetical protein M758_UG322900 [Ceratodon purpureus]